MREIRRRHPQVEVIIITGCSSVETAVEGIRHGVFDYLTKPFDVAEVGATIQRALERRNSRGRLLEFLRGIGEVLGGDRDPLEAAGELSASPELRERIRAAVRHGGWPPERQRDGSAAQRFAQSVCRTLRAAARGPWRRVPHRDGCPRPAGTDSALAGRGVQALQRPDLFLVEFASEADGYGIRLTRGQCGCVADLVQQREAADDR